MYKKIDNFVVFSQKFAGLEDDGQDRLVKAALHLFDTQTSIKKGRYFKNYPLEKKPGMESAPRKGIGR